MSDVRAPVAEKPAVRPGAAAARAPSDLRERDERVVVIRPASRWPHLDIPELWHYRELLATLVWRDVKVRYKQTFVGASWAIIQPFLTMVVFTVIFGKFAQFPSEGLPYPVAVYSGLLPWILFASAITLSSASVVSNRNLVTKVYFPRVMLPLAATVVPVVDFLLASTVMVGLMIWFSVGLQASAMLALPFLLLAWFSALGVGLFFSAVNVRYRDVPYAVPFLVNIWLFLSPVAYGASALPESWKVLLSFNPMTAAITGFRWALVGTPAPTATQLLAGVGVAVAFFLVGLATFRGSEPKFADTI